MVKVTNKKLINQDLITSFGKFHFNENGVSEVEDSAAERLVTLTGFACEDLPTQDEEPENDTTEEDTTEDDAEEKEDVSVDLEAMNVPQLKKYAKENGIDLGAAKTKQEILDVINQ